MVKRVAHSIVHRELGHYEPSGWFIFNDMRLEQCGEHVIQSLADRVGRGSRHWCFRLLLLWWLRGSFECSCCGWLSQTCPWVLWHAWLPIHAWCLGSQSGSHCVRQMRPSTVSHFPWCLGKVDAFVRLCLVS